jgi:lysine-ketoglutarate reductase/saccharopine dehydrogenase-like protein (TIGR00300 family)
MKSENAFLMCEPQFYNVEYVINPWMKGNVGCVDHSAALQQWQRLHETISHFGQVELIPQIYALPDMVFAANGGLAYEGVLVPSYYRYMQRRPETSYFTEWFRERRFRIAELRSGITFEGEGDALFQQGRPLMWGGYGPRTSLAAYRDLAQIFEAEVVPLHLIDERFYHLDTCFCPLPEDRLVYYPKAFDRESLDAIHSRISADNRFEVSDTDALNFACNALDLGNRFIANFAGDDLRRKLESWGFEVALCPLSEFIRAGGSVKCLVLRLNHPVVAREVAAARPATSICEREVMAEGHLLDRGIAGQILDCVKEGGCDFEIHDLQVGQRHDQHSAMRFSVVAPGPQRLDTVLERLLRIGVRLTEGEIDAKARRVQADGVAPWGFYGTTIYPTDLRVKGEWIRVSDQRMDGVIVVGDSPDGVTARCVLIRNLKLGDEVVCGVEGIRIHSHQETREHEPFGFMTSPVSSERRVEAVVEDLAWEMIRAREQKGRIVLVAGPVVIHTGGGAHLARLIRMGYGQALLGGNAIAVHDIEHALFGTSLGIDLKRGGAIHGGHQHHLRAINIIRSCGGIAEAVHQGVLRHGVMYECIVNNIPFCLAGSIRDDGPLPETRMNLITAQDEYAQLIRGASMILMLASTLHAIGVGNMTPAGVRLIAVDINPSVGLKLADRGSAECWSIVTDVGLFLRLLADRLEAENRSGVADAK